MNETVIAVGNGGYNLATDLIAAGLFPDAVDCIFKSGRPAEQ